MINVGQILFPSSSRFLRLLTAILLAALVQACASVEEAPTLTGEYDSESWREIIPESCQSFFDGCNTCSRAAGSTEAACTRRACIAYVEPICLDSNNASIRDNEPELTSRTVVYNCDDGNSFQLSYGVYVTGDQRVRLQDSELIFSDRQTRMARRLTHQVSASGTRYTDSTMEFWGHGDEAMVNEQGQILYSNCVAE